MKKIMRNSMKRVAATFMALVVSVGALGGCGKKADDSVASNGRSIKVYAPVSGTGEDWLNNAAKEYERRTGTKVNVQFDALLGQNLANLLSTTGGDKADIYISDSPEWYQWAMNGFLVDVTDFMNEKGENGQSLNERLKMGKRYFLDEEGNEKQYVVPMGCSATGFAYNKKMMNYLCHDVLGWEKGHDYPYSTKELKEVINALNDITAKGENTELFSYTQDGKTEDVKAFVWSGVVGMLEFAANAWFAQYWGEEGLLEFYNQWENCDLYKDDAYYYVFQTLSDVLDIKKNENGDYYSENSIPNCISFNHTESQSQFLRNKALLCPTGSWFYSEMGSVIEGDENVGFMPVPYMSDDAGNPITAEGVELEKNEDGTYKSVIAMNRPGFYLIPSDSKNQEDAKDFLHFLLSEEYLPVVEEDQQSPVGYICADSEVEKNLWFQSVEEALDRSTASDVFTPCKLMLYGRISFGFVSSPYTKLVMGEFGSSEKMIDSATGSAIREGTAVTGVAVSENVYNYVQENYRKAVEEWPNLINLVGGKK